MNFKVYKWCAVPQCINTSIRTPDKVFVHVPKKKIIRTKWLKLARRNLNEIVTNTSLYFCEDHFDLPNDMENYMEYHVMGSVAQVRMKPGCMPHKFLCQTDWKPQTPDITEQTSIAKKPGMNIREVCEKQLVEKSIEAEQSSSEETASVSSDCEVDEMAGSNKEKTLAMDSDDDSKPELMVCRVCLGREERMFPLAGCELGHMYELCTGLPLDSPAAARVACWQCAGRLRGAATLRRMAAAARDLLVAALADKEKRCEIPEEARRARGLASPLVANVFPGGRLGGPGQCAEPGPPARPPLRPPAVFVAAVTVEPLKTEPFIDMAEIDKDEDLTVLEDLLPEYYSDNCDSSNDSDSDSSKPIAIVIGMKNNLNNTNVDLKQGVTKENAVTVTDNGSYDKCRALNSNKEFRETKQNVNRRGRPKKLSLENSDTIDNIITSENKNIEANSESYELSKAPKRRGRPRKVREKNSDSENEEKNNINKCKEQKKLFKRKRKNISCANSDIENNLKNSDSDFSETENEVNKNINSDSEPEKVVRRRGRPKGKPGVKLKRNDPGVYVEVGTDLTSNEPVTAFIRDKFVPKLEKDTKENAGRVSSMFSISRVTLEEQLAAVEARRAASLSAPLSALLTCRLCWQTFSHRREFSRDQYRHSDASGKFECAVCRRRSQSGPALQAHYRHNHTRQFRCQLCPHAVYKLSAAVTHLNSHEGRQFPCQYCEKTFPSAAGRLNHTRYGHATRHVCGFCGDSLASAWGRATHMRKAHPKLLKEYFAADGLTPLKPLAGPRCEPCGAAFLSVRAADNHADTAHRHKKGGHQAAGGRGGPRPVRPDDGDAMRTCDTCGQAVAARCYARHVRGHTARAHMCDQCGLTFLSAGALAAHAWRHSGQKAHGCAQCGARFSQKGNLHTHLKLWHGAGARPWHACGVCGKRLRHRGNLARHMQLHSGGQWFPCSLCGKRVTTRASLRQHVRHVHNREPWPPRRRAPAAGLRRRTVLQPSPAPAPAGTPPGRGEGD